MGSRARSRLRPGARARRAFSLTRSSPPEPLLRLQLMDRIVTGSVFVSIAFMRCVSFRAQNGRSP